MDSSALMTDHYELTMLQAALHSGTAHRKCVFEAFARKLPDGRRYGVVAGTGRLLELLKNFTFNEEEIDFLRKNKVVNEETLEYLKDYKFSGNIYGYPEGELYFPNSPILIVEGTFAEACIIETLVLSVLNHDSAIASAAARMVGAAADRPCIEMGTRRTHEESAVAAARAAAIVGFATTSNLEAGRRYGIATQGTSAHSFTLLHDSEEEAFKAQIESLGKKTTLLVDTYNVENAVHTAVKLAGPELGGVRLDSGDLASQAKSVRKLLDSLGATKARIVVTSDLDEYAIAALQVAPVDGYGVGTQLVTGSGHPTAAMVYKLVSHEDESGIQVPVAKKASGKKSIGGRKYAYRELANDIAQTEVITTSPDYEATDNERPILVQLVKNGKINYEYTGETGVANAQKHFKKAFAELPEKGLSLQKGDPIINTVFKD
ncbi:MAG: nicotinate phosphoribosyltransferase [Micrococcaceae bacterium]